MFGELPKIFDRNFAVNYFLPVTAFLGLSYFLFSTYGLLPGFTHSIAQDFLKGAVTLSLFSYFGGVLLLILSNDMYAFLSGKGKYNPFRLFQRFESRRFRKMLGEIERLDSEYLRYMEIGKDVPQKVTVTRNRLMGELAVEFPDRERLVLPTPFGNIMRSVEIYSRFIYGFDYFGGWSRMLTVIPSDYRNIIEASKGQVDFWVNTYILSVLYMVEVLVVWRLTGNNILLILAGSLIMLGSSFIIRAQSAAISWGEYIASAFDVYRFKLLDLLGIKRPTTREDEQMLWTRFSQATIYRRPDVLPDLEGSLTSTGQSTLQISLSDAPPQEKEKEVMYVTPPEVKIELITPYKVRKKKNMNS